jgi:hypothetical protein
MNMGGCTRGVVETKSISLLQIHSVTSSNIDEDSDSNLDVEDEEENEELQCLFTVTTTNGDVHVFEAITPEETVRLVTGIKNISARFAGLVIAGNSRVLEEFYDQHGDPDAATLTQSEALAKLSHALLDA